MKLHHRFIYLAVALAVSLAGSLAPAADWGDLKGRFIFDGKAPTPGKVNVNKDEAVCGKHPLVDESLIVGAGGELRDAVIYLRTPKDPAIHPDYEKTAKAEISLDNKNCRFDPHVVVLRTTQALLLKNSDPVGHNSKIDALINPAINVLIPPGGAAPTNFSQEEGLPMRVGCNIHPWMGGWVVLKAHPYAAASDEKGTFEIKNVPAGTELEFVFWQEKAGYLKNAAFKGGKADTKGRFKITLKPGVNDLGDIKVAPSTFAK